jgi:hypothetical protein
MIVLLSSILRQLSFAENRESLCRLVFGSPMTFIDPPSYPALYDFLISLILHGTQGLDRPCRFVIFCRVFK